MAADPETAAGVTSCVKVIAVPPGRAPATAGDAVDLPAISGTSMTATSIYRSSTELLRYGVVCGSVVRMASGERGWVHTHKSPLRTSGNK